MVALYLAMRIIKNKYGLFMEYGTEKWWIQLTPENRYSTCNVHFRKGPYNCLRGRIAEENIKESCIITSSLFECSEADTFWQGVEFRLFLEFENSKFVHAYFDNRLYRDVEALAAECKFQVEQNMIAPLAALALEYLGPV